MPSIDMSPFAHIAVGSVLRLMLDSFTPNRRNIVVGASMVVREVSPQWVRKARLLLQCKKGALCDREGLLAHRAVSGGPVAQ